MEAGTGDPSSLGHLIEGNSITGRVSHGIHMEGNGSQEYPKATTARIVNNRIYDINSSAYSGSENHYSIGIILQHNSICTNNRIENVHFYGIKSAGDTIISENSIINVAAQSGIRSNYGHSLIKGNIIEHVGNYGIKNGYIVSDNYIYDSRYGIDGAHTMTGNYIEEATTGIIVNQHDAILGNNHIIDCSYAAMDISNDNDLTITGNIIENCGSSHAIRLSNAQNCVLTGNRIFDCSYSICEQNGADYNIIISNNCRGNDHAIQTSGANTVTAYNIDS
jgi:parallel beta-helix repeat protein